MTKTLETPQTNEIKFRNNIFWRLTTYHDGYTGENFVSDYEKLSHESKVFLVIRFFHIYEREKYTNWAKQLAPLPCSVFCDAVHRLVNSAHKKGIIKDFCSLMVSDCHYCYFMSKVAQELWEQENLISDGEIDRKHYSEIKFLEIFTSANLEINENPSFDLRFKREILRFALNYLYHTEKKSTLPSNFVLPKKNHDEINQLISKFSAYEPITIDDIKYNDSPRIGTCGLTDITKLLKENHLFEEPDDDDWYSHHANAAAKEKSRSILKNMKINNQNFYYQSLENIFMPWVKNRSKFLDKKPQQSQDPCGLCGKRFESGYSKQYKQKFFVIHKAMKNGKCSEVYHLHCLLEWIIFHNTYLLHYNGSYPLTRNMRTFHVTYPCPNCKEEGHLVTQPIQTWTIKNWATRGNQKEDMFVDDRGLDNQHVYGISCVRLSVTTE
jgi:hypothetical protein